MQILLIIALLIFLLSLIVCLRVEDASRVKRIWVYFVTWLVLNILIIAPSYLAGHGGGYTLDELPFQLVYKLLSISLCILCLLEIFNVGKIEYRKIKGSGAHKGRMMLVGIRKEILSNLFVLFILAGLVYLLINSG